jgi:hypothetical protein
MGTLLMQLSSSTRCPRLSVRYSKQGRISQFRTKKERDAWLSTEIKQVGPDDTLFSL